MRISKPVDLVKIIDKLVSALEKVYQEKAIVVERSLPARMLLRMDEGDCLEVVGNLLDNAFKYGNKRIDIESRESEDKSMTLVIEDDGVGLAPAEIEQILNRGLRLDEVTEGQGIGLAVVADIVESYDIELNFSTAKLGGLRASLEFHKVG
jgi:two-component system sensor histidine kinase PhoQ